MPDKKRKRVAKKRKYDDYIECKCINILRNILYIILFAKCWLNDVTIAGQCVSEDDVSKVKRKPSKGEYTS